MFVILIIKLYIKEIESKALDGQVLIYKHAQGLIEKKVGHKVSDDYVWDLFKRHGWKKKVPRQGHPKADKEKQEAF